MYPPWLTVFTGPDVSASEPGRREKPLPRAGQNVSRTPGGYRNHGRTNPECVACAGAGGLRELRDAVGRGLGAVRGRDRDRDARLANTQPSYAMTQSQHRAGPLFADLRVDLLERPDGERLERFVFEPQHAVSLVLATIAVGLSRIK